MALVALMCSFAERLFSLFSLYYFIFFFFLLRCSKDPLSRLETNFFFCYFGFCLKYIECCSRDGNDGNDWKGMNQRWKWEHDTEWINGTLYLSLELVIWDESLASLFVCGKRVCCYSCVFALLLLLLGFWFVFLLAMAALPIFVERLHTRSVLALLVFCERDSVVFLFSSVLVSVG
ncbi:hypothetical protein GGI35DRAFT_120989 [Trichoderma velutinum]